MATKAVEVESGCFAKALHDEPLFVLRAKDRLAPKTVRFWAKCAEDGCVHEAQKIDKARRLADAMEQWRGAHFRRDPVLHVDEARWNDRAALGRERTGVLIRARFHDGRYDSVDIACLTKASLLTWLRSRGGDNKLAEDVVGVLLGYGHIS